MTKTALPLAAIATMLLASTAMAAPAVVASTKPLHALVSAVMGEAGQPSLIVKGAASPHTYSLRPSDAAALESADIVFWTGHGMELFLGDALDSLVTDAVVVELAETPGLTLLPLREGGAFEAHSHGDEDDGHDHDHGHDHAHGDGDMHFWLDPENAKLMVTQIAVTLAEADPDNSVTYLANAEAERLRLDALTLELTKTLAPVTGKPFIVFHDAYQYFEHHYGVLTAGSITVSPETLPGAERLTQIRDKVKTLGATCVFAEPQFEPKLVNVVIEGTPARSGTLDPEAATLEPGPDLYFALMKGMAASLRDCLGQGG